MDRQEYLNSLSEQIRCKRAIPYVTKELEDHIEDQKEYFIAQGIEETEAEDTEEAETAGAEVTPTEKAEPTATASPTPTEKAAK